MKTCAEPCSPFHDLKLYEAILNNSAHAIIATDVNGIVTLFNKTAQKLLGYSEEEVVGKHTPALWHDALETIERAKEFTLELGLEKQITPGFEVYVVKTNLGLPNEEEWTYISKTGKRILVRLSITALKEDGKVSSYFGTAVDITEQKKTQQALLKSRERLNEAQHLAHIGSWTLDLVNNQLEWSDEIYTIFELEKNSFNTTYENFIKMIHPEDRALVNRTYENSVKSKEPYTIQHRLLMRDGRIKYVKEEAVTLYCTEGEPILSQGTIQDITQTVLLQESILNERNFANALIDNANSIVVVFDIEGRLVRLNQYGLEFVKYTQEELSKEPYAWLKLIPKGVLSEVKSVFDKAINGDLMKRHQNKWMSKEGEERYFEWSNALVFDPKGAIEYIVSIGTDISDRIRIEEDLLKADKDNKKQLEVIDQHVLAMHLDQKGITLSASTAFAELIGYDKSEIVGLRLKHIKAFRNHDLLNDLHEKDHKTVELELLSKSKDQIWLEAMIATEYNEDEKIRGLNIFFQDITDKKKIEELTHYDHLTKIFNRRKMDIVLSEEIERHQRYGSELSLIMIDLDYFKEVNDKFGHQVGDAVLEGAANILKENIRKTDALGRIGGEEFLIVCPQTSLQQCKILATKIKETIESFDFEIAGKKTASIGVTTIKNFDTKDSFFKRADEAMYEAKREGRNQVRVK